MRDLRFAPDNKESEYTVGNHAVSVKVSFAYDSKANNVIARLSYEDASGDNTEFFLNPRALLLAIESASKSQNWDLRGEDDTHEDADLIVRSLLPATILVEDYRARLAIGMFESHSAVYTESGAGNMFPEGLFTMDMADLRAMFEYTFERNV